MQHARLIVDGREVEDAGFDGDSDWFGALRESAWEVELDAGQQVHLSVEFVNPGFNTYARVQPVLPATAAP